MKQMHTMLSLAALALSWPGGPARGDEAIIVREDVAVGRVSSVRTGGEKPVAASPHVLKLSKVAQVQFMPGGRVLLTVGGEDTQVHLWSAANGEEVNRFGDSVKRAVVSGDGARVMTWGSDGVTRIFDAQSGKALRRLEGAGKEVGAGALSPDGSRAVTCAAGEAVIKVWDCGSGKMVGTLLGHGAPVTWLAISPDGARAVSVSEPSAGAASNDRSLRCWDLQARKELKKIELSGAGQFPTFSANGKLIILLEGTAAKIYELSSGKAIVAPRTPEEYFPPASVSGDRKMGIRKAVGSTVLVNMISGEVIRPLEGKIDGIGMCDAFSADGKRLILGTGKASLFSQKPDEPGNVYIYDVASGKCLGTFTGHERAVTQVGLSPDGTCAFSRDGDQTVFMWAVK